MPNDSFQISYRHFVAYFAGIQTITEHHLVIGANFTYGWMPTILEFKSGAFSAAASILNRAKANHRISARELRLLANLINNSVVGASKLLHFVNPHTYAIWDSNVYRYINGKSPQQYQVNNCDNYFAYLENLSDITRDPRFPPVHDSMNAKIGYTVSPYRATELVMFMTRDAGL